MTMMQVDRIGTGNKLKTLRVCSGLTMMGLAEKLDVSVNSIVKWESGKCLPTMDRLCELSLLYSEPIDGMIMRRYQFD